MCELGPDIVRWGLHHLLDVRCVSSGGSPGSTTRNEKDLSQFEYVKEGYCEIEHDEVENDEIIAHVSPGSITYEKNLSQVEYVKEVYCGMEHDEVENDEIIAHAFQEELSQLAAAEASGISHADDEHLQASILAQDWQGPSKRHCTFEQGNCQDDADGKRKSSSCSSMRGKSIDLEDWSYSPEIAAEFTIDGEVGKRLNQMVPVPHVPKINGEIPSVDQETSDHQRLLDRLHLYDLAELKVQGDGNCQFRSLSDQIYRTTEHHKFVRRQVVDQLKSHPELYEGYVPMPFDDYLKHISKIGEWGDHVTLQAAADAYGVKVFIITSFRDTCYIEILPHTQKSKRIIILSFWAEVHYNSIYPEGDLPSIERRKKWWWWML